MRSSACHITTRLALALCCASAFTGCSSESGATGSSSAGTSAPAAGGGAPESSAGGSGPSAAPSGGAAGMAKVSDAMLPCAVVQALAHACHSCHGPVPTNGAPMSLTAWEDFQRNSIVKPRPPMHEVARKRIDGTRLPLMPPGGGIEAEDKQVLLDWLGMGAPAAEAGDACP